MPMLQAEATPTIAPREKGAFGAAAEPYLGDSAFIRRWIRGCACVAAHK